MESNHLGLADQLSRVTGATESQSLQPCVHTATPQQSKIQSRASSDQTGATDGLW